MPRISTPGNAGLLVGSSGSSFTMLVLGRSGCIWQSSIASICKSFELVQRGGCVGSTGGGGKLGFLVVSNGYPGVFSARWKLRGPLCCCCRCCRCCRCCHCCRCGCGCGCGCCCGCGLWMLLLSLVLSLWLFLLLLLLLTCCC